MCVWGGGGGGGHWYVYKSTILHQKISSDVVACSDVACVTSSLDILMLLVVDMCTILVCTFRCVIHELAVTIKTQGF